MDPYGNVIFNNIGELSFPSSQLNISTSKTLTIQNIENANLKLKGKPTVIVSGIGASAFLISCQTNIVIKPGDSSTFTIQFTPLAGQLYEAIITIPNNDSTSDPFIFTVKGTGLAPIIKVKQNSSYIPNISGRYDFGNVAVNDSSIETSFIIENLGTYDLNLTGYPKIEISGIDAALFDINQSMVSVQISPGNATMFTISFNPDSIGNKSATIIIQNDDFTNIPYNFEVTGNCVPSYYWTKRIGNTGGDFGSFVTADIQGNIYWAGGFECSVDFGTDFGYSDLVTSAGSTDSFLTKLSQ